MGHGFTDRDWRADALGRQFAFAGDERAHAWGANVRRCAATQTQVTLNASAPPSVPLSCSWPPVFLVDYYSISSVFPSSLHIFPTNCIMELWLPYPLLSPIPRINSNSFFVSSSPRISRQLEATSLPLPTLASSNAPVQCNYIETMSTKHQNEKK